MNVSQPPTQNEAIFLADQYGPANRHPFVLATVVECIGIFMGWVMCAVVILAESLTSQPHNYVLPCFWIVAVLCTIINFLINQRAGYSGDPTSDAVYYVLATGTVVMEFYLAVSGVIGHDTAGYDVYKNPVLLGHVSNLFPADGIVTEDEGYLLQNTLRSKSPHRNAAHACFSRAFKRSMERMVFGRASQAFSAPLL